MKVALFQLGQVVATKGISEHLEPKVIDTLIMRHVTGDYGEIKKSDWEANEQALKHGGRILSSYQTEPGQVNIITEFAAEPGTIPDNRNYTTILFADEY